MNKSSSILPILLITSGLLESLFPFFILFVTLPQIANIYNKQTITYNPIEMYGPILLVIAIIVSQIIYGIKMLIKQKNMVGLDNRDKKIAIILLVCGGFVTMLGIGLALGSASAPLYRSLVTGE